MNYAECIIGITVIVWVVADLIIYAKQGNDATISATMWTLSQKYPAIPFFFGLLCGHFFLQMHLSGSC